MNWTPILKTLYFFPSECDRTGGTNIKHKAGQLDHGLSETVECNDKHTALIPANLVVKCTDGVYGSANAKCSPGGIKSIWTESYGSCGWTDKNQFVSDQPDVDIMFMTSSALMDNCAAITGSTPHTLSTLAAQNKKKFKKQLEIFTAWVSSDFCLK